MKKIALLFRLAGTLTAILLLSACGSVPPESPEKTQAPKTSENSKTKTFDVLSRHDTNAVFVGLRRHKCLGRSMLCPDRCGHSGTLAVFKIERYNAYEKPSEYGDEKADEFAVMLNSTTGTNTVSGKLAEQIRALKPGEKVRLVWEHIYVSTPEGSHFPERVIRELNPL